MKAFVRWLAIASVLCVSSGCTDTELYSTLEPRKQADRVALKGQVCTEDPVEAQFPLRVVLLVDQAAGPLYSSFDLGQERLGALEDFVQGTLANPQSELAIIGWAGGPRKLAPTTGDFTRNPGELLNAVAQTSLSAPCVGEERCRDRAEALRTARALIEGDLAGSPDGLKVLTQYVVVMVVAGPSSPVVNGAACCAPDDTECIDAGGDPSAACQAQLDAEQVSDLREYVTQQGAAGLRFHTIQLAAEADVDVNNQVQSALESMAFAGGGTFQRFDSPGGLALRALDLLGLRTLLRAKLLVAANLNARPTPDGPQVDSDGDGLTDSEEEVLGTLPEAADSDGDGIGDFIETLVNLDPTVVDAPRACEKIRVGTDRDLDGLSDCDEELLGTSPTLVDTDGDGMPDRLEVVGRTDYLSRDAEQDSDGDGVNNGEEILLRGDPRSTDTREHLSSGYRYEVEDLGVSTQLFANLPELVTGVEIVGLSGGTTPGLGTLYWDATASALRWQDALDATPGPPVFIDTMIADEYELPSSSWAPVQGDAGKAVTVTVDPVELAPTAQTESIRVVFRQRQCLDYTIRNVRLVPTLERANGLPAGTNDILLFFAQAPEGRIDAPGPYRMAQIPIVYQPPATRTPDGSILEVDNAEFVRPTIIEE